jgi:tetratricopeptide (TPR) repeat protein/O-antigen ligase
MSKKIFSIYLFLLVFAPFAFGTVEEWSLAVMEAFSFCAIMLLLLRRLKYNPPFLYEVPGILPLALFLAYMLLQLVPLPPAVIGIISPNTYALYKKTIWIDSPMTWASLSIHRKATLTEFFRISAYAAFYVVTVQLLTKREYLKKTVMTVIASASFLSLLAILQLFLSNGRIFWLRAVPQYVKPFGPYVNRNHYAGLMEMIFPLVFGLFLYYKPKTSYSSLREKIVEIFNHRRINTHIMLGFSLVLIATSVFLSLSRGGITSLCLAMIFFGGVLSFSKMRHKRSGVVVLIFFVILLSFTWFGWEPIFKRFENIRNPQGNISDLRAVIWQDSFGILGDFAFAGTGFGTFVNIYPKYRTISGHALLDHAHNDYIELAADGGFPGVLLAGCFLLVVLYKSFSVFRSRREPYSIYLYAGSVAGMIAIFFHSITDFNLQIGANGLYFFFLAGLAVSSSHTRMRESVNGTRLRKITPAFLRPMIFAVAAVFLANVLLNTGIIIGKLEYFRARKVSPGRSVRAEDLTEMKNLLGRAAFFDPLDARYRYALANTELSLADRDNALIHAREAVALTPSNGEYQQKLGLIISHDKHYDAAEKLLRSGIEYDISNPERYKTCAAWFLSRGRKDDGLHYVKMAISLAPEKTREYIALLVLNNLTDEEIKKALPDRSAAYLQFADYLEKTGNDPMAEEAYRDALYFMKDEQKVNRSHFFTLYGHYRKKERYDDALNVMRRAIEVLPKDPQIRIATASLYEKLGIRYKAIEEYRTVLVLDPGNREASRRLEGLAKKD